MQINKRYVLILIVLLTFWIQVICQSTLGNMQNRKCQDTSTELRQILNKLQDIDDKVNMMEINGKQCIPLLLFSVYSILKLGNIFCVRVSWYFLKVGLLSNLDFYLDKAAIVAMGSLLFG